MILPIDVIPLGATFAVTLAAIMLACELGYRGGRWRRSRKLSEQEGPVGGMVAAELGLLAFLLAFTFNIAASRFDDRRHAILDEANAIGTTFLRAEMLSDPQRSEVRRLLREYVEVRLPNEQLRTIDEAIQQSEALQTQLWQQAVEAAASDPSSEPIALFIESLNEVIDLHATRVILRARVPATIWAALMIVAALAFCSMGYHGGLTGTTRSPAVLIVGMTFAAVIWLVADIDRPREGLLMTSQQPLIQLQESMAEQP